MKSKPSSPLRLSYSAVQDWRQCQQLWFYKHVERVQPKVRQAAPELGTMIHDYLERYYSALSNDTDPTIAHRRAGKRAILSRREEIRSLAGVADTVGDEPTALALLAIPATARALMIAYHRVHGGNDAKRHKVLLVEEEFELPARDGVVLPGKIDLVTEDSQGIWLWEHKSTGSIPERGRRFRDLQTLIYAVALDEVFNIKVSGVIWNYIRTTPPRMPHALKPKKDEAISALSVAKNQTTTVELVEKAIKKYDLDAKPYAAFLRNVERAERQQMFVRYQQPIVQAENVLLRDYIASSYEIEKFRAGGTEPIRNIAAHCDWCPMMKLCQAVVTGGEDASIRRLYYERREERHGTKHPR